MPCPFKVVIPARFASTRLPAKPLADLAGKPMVVRVLEQALRAGADEVWVATDHPAVLDAVQAAGGKALMTRADHPSGTDRIAEVVEARGWPEETVVVNVQGDEPLIDPKVIQSVAQALLNMPDAAIATAAHPLETAEALFNPNIVKVVTDQTGRAHYFSRAPIPWARDAFAQSTQTLPAAFPALRHVGIYAYRGTFLKRYATLTPSPLEKLEALEQLRALWHGYGIAVITLPHAPAPGVDTPEDLARVRTLFAQHSTVA